MLALDIPLGTTILCQQVQDLPKKHSSRFKRARESRGCWTPALLYSRDSEFQGIASGGNAPPQFAVRNTYRCSVVLMAAATTSIAPSCRSAPVPGGFEVATVGVSCSRCVLATTSHTGILPESSPSSGRPAGGECGIETQKGVVVNAAS